MINCFRAYAIRLERLPPPLDAPHHRTPSPRPSRWFWQLEYAALIVLPSLAYFQGDTAASSAVDYTRCGLQLGLTAALAFAYVKWRPYEPTFYWMLPAKLLSLGVATCLACLTLVVALTGKADAAAAAGADGAGGGTRAASDPGARHRLVAAAVTLEVFALLLCAALAIVILGGAAGSVARDAAADDRSAHIGRLIGRSGDAVGGTASVANVAPVVGNPAAVAIGRASGAHPGSAHGSSRLGVRVRAPSRTSLHSSMGGAAATGEADGGSAIGNVRARTHSSRADFSPSRSGPSRIAS